MRPHKKTFPLPEKFHTLLKFEAVKSGKTMTTYCEDLAKECEERQISFREHLLKSKNEKKFMPRF